MPCHFSCRFMIVLVLLSKLDISIPSADFCLSRSGCQAAPNGREAVAASRFNLRLSGGGAIVPCLPIFSEEQVHAQLIRAAKNGHIDKMHRLVRWGAHVNTSNERGQTPLIKAAECGQLDAVVQLLKLGANIDLTDGHGSNALHYAAFNGHTSTVVALLRKGQGLINHVNKFGYTALHYAAADGHAATVAALVALGAEVNHVDNMNLTALHRAAAGGHVATIHELVRSGASVHGTHTPNKSNCLATHDASIKHRADHGAPHPASIRAVACLDLLVSPAQDTSAVPSEHAAIQEEDKPASSHVNNYTPLHEAAWCNQLGSVKALVSLGASLHASDKWGKTPLGLPSLELVVVAEEEEEEGSEKAAAAAAAAASAASLNPKP